MKRFLTASICALALTTAVAAQAQTATTTKVGTENVITKTGNTVTNTALTPVAATSALTASKNEKEFRMNLSGPGTLSLKTANIAVDKATNPEVKEFAQFEKDEQETLAKVLKDLNTPDAVPTEKDKATLDMLNKAAKGPEFDKAFVKAQYDTHLVLQSIGEGYLKNADMGSKDPVEKEGQHLAMLSGSTIRQHIATSSKLNAKLNGTK